MDVRLLHQARGRPTVLVLGKWRRVAIKVTIAMSGLGCAHGQVHSTVVGPAVQPLLHLVTACWGCISTSAKATSNCGFAISHLLVFHGC